MRYAPRRYRLLAWMREQARPVTAKEATMSPLYSGSDGAPDDLRWLEAEGLVERCGGVAHSAQTPQLWRVAAREATG